MVDHSMHNMQNIVEATGFDYTLAFIAGDARKWALFRDVWCFSIRIFYEWKRRKVIFSLFRLSINTDFCLYLDRVFSSVTWCGFCFEWTVWKSTKYFANGDWCGGHYSCIGDYGVDSMARICKIVTNGFAAKRLC